MRSGAWPEAERVDWRCWSDARAGVGETPVWSADGRLFWSDLVAPSLHSGDGSGVVQTWRLPDMVGSYALLSDESQAVLALSSGIYCFDLTTGELERRYDAPYDPLMYRFNDGCCDSRGRFWVGTNRRPGSGMRRGSSAYYRLDERGLQWQFDGVTIANGTAFSPDGSIMYVADTTTHRILAREYDLAVGEAGTPRVLAQLGDSYFPDGASVDRDGGYWVALYGSGLIINVAPDGAIDRVLRAPVSHPTMVTFGGPDLATMFVTSGRSFVDPEVLATEPLAGGVFAAEIGVSGLPTAHFGQGISTSIT